MITIGDNPPTWDDVDDALRSLAGPPVFAPYARFEHDGTAITLIPASLEDGARMQGMLEHIIRDHVNVSAYISAWHDGPGAVTVILATRGAADMDRVLDAVTLEPADGTGRQQPSAPRPPGVPRRPGPGRSGGNRSGRSPKA